MPTKRNTRSYYNAAQQCTPSRVQSLGQNMPVLALQTGGLNSHCCCRCPSDSSLMRRHSRQSRTSITLQLLCPRESAVCCLRYMTINHLQFEYINACQVLDKALGPLGAIDLAI